MTDVSSYYDAHAIVSFVWQIIQAADVSHTMQHWQ